MAQQFALDIAEFVRKVGDRAEAATKKVAISVLSETVLATPVQADPDPGGHLRRNWQLGAGQNRSTQVEGADRDGAATIRDGTANLQPFQIGQTIFITNNLPYAAVVEFGGYPNPPKTPTGKTTGGYSIQAPRGMLGIAAARWQEFVTDAVRKLP